MFAVSDALISAGRWRIDPRRSTVGFSVRHMGVATVRGHFTSFGGVLQAGDDDLMAEGHVDVASVDTGNAIRDARLRAEFFDAERFPAITFTGRDATRHAGDETIVTGDLTIRGVTRTIALAVTAKAGAGDEVIVHAEGDLSRAAFGLDWDALREAGRLLVGDRVRLTLDLGLQQVAELQARGAGPDSRWV